MTKDINKKKPRKGLKVTLITIGSLLGVVVLTAGSYVGYVIGQYYRIEDNQVLDVNHARSEEAPLNTELKLTSLNIGFGAYSHDYTFFMDRGVDPDGTVKNGKYAKARSEAEAKRNTKGCIDLITSDALKSDFYALQEVDIDSNRARFVNQEQEVIKGMNAAFGYDYAETFAINYHSAYTLYPFNDPIGAATGGLQTLSKYNISSSLRKSYTVSDAFPDKYFDLDRCFSVNRIELKDCDKQLILINSHMSAYDEGGVIRNQQLKELNGFMLDEFNKGNYIVAGGDFNHDLVTNNPLYPEFYEKGDKHNYPFAKDYTQLRPFWTSMMFDENKKCNLDDVFTIHAGTNAPTCRGVDEPYKLGRTYCTIVDGFIVSSNVEVKSVINTDMASDLNVRYSYSDHQPTTLTFKLIA